MSERYNGWTNYETWCVNLWLDNDEGTQSFWAAQAAHEVQDHGDKDEASYPLAKQLEMVVRDEMPEIGNNMYSDMLGSAISSVDWREIAERMIEDVEA